MSESAFQQRLPESERDPSRDLQSGKAGAPPRKKRRRQINSCSECRRRRSRCDRRLPCGECSKNKCSCHYIDDLDTATTTQKRDTSAKNASFPPTAPSASQELPLPNPTRLAETQEDLTARVHKLESLLNTYLPVLSRLQSSQNTADCLAHRQSPHAQPQSVPANTCIIASSADVPTKIPKIFEAEGYLRGKNGRKTEFVSNRHWTGLIYLFPEIYSLRNEPSSHPICYMISQVFRHIRERGKKQKPEPLSSVVPSLSIDTALRGLVPSKSLASTLLNVYLENFENTHRVIHIPSFKEEFEAFWRSPGTLSLSWIANLVIILRLGLLAHPDRESISKGASPEWLQRIESQGLQLAELFSHCRSSEGRPSLDYVQTQCLLVVARITDGSKATIAWKLAGQLVQTCVIMGFHQELELVGGTMSIFDAEMRRRLWTTALELYIHVSRHASVHESFLQAQYNIRRPSNINDRDMSAGMTHLPTPDFRVSISDTSFQHALSESLGLRLRLVSSHRNDLGQAELTGDHCASCGLRNRLLLKAPYVLSNGQPFEQGTYDQRQHVMLCLTHQSTFLHYKLIDLFKDTGSDLHSKELVLDACRSILRLYQHPDLSPVQRYIVGRWYRNDILTSVICLCLTLRLTQPNGADRCVVPLTQDLSLVQQSLKLVEDTLYLLSMRQDQTQNETEEHVLLVLLFAIVKSKGIQTDIPGQLQECLRSLGLPVLLPPGENSLEGTGDSLTERHAPSGPNLEAFAPTPKSFSSVDMDMVFDIDSFMSEFALDIPF
ncbi:hypothetical protein BDV38DRAFT_289223 [Aspergillus pseudotamarii]|uniref:Zn(2)-C6 fungal-type domain-containing protein n=1 Tax=Aspergillus pseudotamarii TaxID=132259 RepID=A0A5N6SBV4_ASPPS|nr:uncharacterized protein BDV38DRAFT_289223 [Aspergillus pseudotamarii]KAE8130883.1 hypothetical protein BDV38DRAFT_289223 [Aspergillus pseudotamarii]